jgi:hypothetical protein
MKRTRAMLAVLVPLAALALALALDCAADDPQPPSGTPAPQAGASVGSYEPRRPEFERIAATLLEGMNPFLGSGPIRESERLLAQQGLDTDRRIWLLARLADQLLKAGRPDEALARTDEALALIDRSRPSPRLALLYELRGLVHLRRAELENCVHHHRAESCLFPLRGSGIHVARRPATAARADYERALALDPGNLRVRWLLNIVNMALGSWPDGVPEPLRIPAASLESDHDPGRFTDIAPRLGLDTFDQCGGAVVEDFDNDGLLDVVTSSFDPLGPLHYHRNRGDGSFEDRSAASLADDQLGGLNVVAADYDNDGRRDLLVLRGAWLLADGEIRNSLLRNNPDGTFRDVTGLAGVARPASPTQAAVWADFDNDGDLDLYVGNESSREFERGAGNYPSQLFLNEGQGTFRDVAAAAGVTNDRYCKGVAAGDYDDDGDMDLYVSNVGRNRLYRNEGGMRFKDVAARAGVAEPAGRSFAPWFFDYDNDGRLDLWVPAYEATVADVAAEYFGLPHKGKLPRLYHNEGGGRFRDVTARAGLDHVYLPMGANFGDLDNDGWLDFYLGTGEPDFRALMPNVMLRNDGAGRFQDVTTAGGFGHLQKGHGVAFADLDNDGDQDVFHQVGGFYAGDRFHNALFENPGHGNRFLTVKLVGTRSNRDAVGARLLVRAKGPAGSRNIHRAVGSVSSFGGSPIRQEIGLGRATAIERVEVYWPASGERQVLRGVPLDAAIRVTEGKDGFEPLPFPRVRLGAAAEREP